MNHDMIDTLDSPRVFDHLVADILPLMNDEARTLHKDAQTYTLSFLPFTLNLFYGIIMGIKSIGLLTTHIRTSPHREAFGLVNASKLMYSEAFGRYSPLIYRRLFYALLQRLDCLEIPEIKALGIFYLVDGSVFPAIGSMVWASYTKKANAIKLHLSFELNRMIPVQFFSTHANASEQQTLLKMVEAGITYIADRGYVCFDVFYTICQKGAHFIIRGKCNHVYEVLDTFVVEIPETWTTLFHDLRDVKITFANDSHHGMYRLVSFTVADTFFVLVTNRFDLTTGQIIMLYAYRWQVELIFRFLKRTLNGIHLMCHSAAGVEIQFLMFMMAYLVLLSFKQECQRTVDGDPEAREPHQASLSTADSERSHAVNQAVPHISSARQGNGTTPIHTGYEFVAVPGKKLKKYWKIGIHWLTALRNLLLEPFTSKFLKIITCMQ